MGGAPSPDHGLGASDMGADARRLAAVVAGLHGFAFERILAASGALHYAWVSPNAGALLGLADANLKANASGCLDIIHWADRDEHLAEIRRSAAALDVCRETYRAITREGGILWFEGSSIPSKRDDGSVVWIGAVCDVTEGRRAALRLDMLMDHAGDSILILDGDGRVDTVNAAGLSLFGYGEGDLVGEPFQILLPKHLRGEDLSHLVGTGPQEITGLKRDGGLFDLEVTVSEVRLESGRQFLVIGRDISRRRRAETALRETEQRLGAIAGNLPGMVFQRRLGPEGRVEFTYVSERSRDILGLEPEELMAKPEHFLALLPPDGREPFMDALRLSASTMERFDEEMSVPTPKGRRWLRGQSQPNRRPDGSVVWDGLLLDVTGRKQAEQRLAFLAFHDSLTRLPNRAAFLERFAAVAESPREEGGVLLVASMGLDRLGMINATMGHAVGDHVLVAAADLLQAALGPSDMLARSSGDRFLILLAGHASKKEAMDALERLHLAAQATVTAAGQEFDISATVGGALFPRDGEDADTLIRNADAALQRAKAQGPATLQMFTKEMGTKAAKMISLQARLRRAIENGELSAHYQPQVDLITGSIIGMEALVRWQSPELGFVSPAEFIPVAEESGLIDAVCETMLDASTRQLRQWQDQGLPPIPVAVNVSGRQFQYARRLLTACERVLEASGLDPQWLELELTESSAMSDADNAIAVVQQLREMGIGCAIDDFGTGYSSLSVLKRFPIRKLKIDRSFVMDITTDPNDAAIVDAIVAVAKALRLKVVAEGVETQEHLDFLRRLGADQIQGYFFSKPLPADAMGAMLAEGRRLELQPLPLLGAAQANVMESAC